MDLRAPDPTLTALAGPYVRVYIEPALVSIAHFDLERRSEHYNQGIDHLNDEDINRQREHRSATTSPGAGPRTAGTGTWPRGTRPQPGESRSTHRGLVRPAAACP